MNQKNKISSITFTAVFFFVVIVLGVISFTKLTNFYINDVTDYNEWSPSLGNKFETDIASSFYQKFNFVNLNGAARNLLRQQEMNGIIKLNNGWLVTTCNYVSDEMLQKNADCVISLKNYLEKQGIAFLYGIPPYTTSKYDPQLPEGISDYGNDNLDRLGKMLAAGGVEVIDFRETMHEDGIDQYDMIYRTDHHWTSRAGFYAYTKINERLQQILDCQVDPSIKNFSNYTVTNYKNWHLGSRGQRTGAYFAGIDDFELIMPNFETSLKQGDKEGTYESLIINMSALDNRNPTSRYTYDTVLGNANQNYTNPNAWNDKKLLVVTDSFGKAVNPFLILSYRELRYMGSGLTWEYLESYKPDAVIMFYYVNNAVSSNYYNFSLPIKD